jgi:alanyl-tRNA synthetase
MFMADTPHSEGMTRQLYELDPYCSTFEALVIEVAGDWVVLDRSAFYPGGGGQETDRGTLNGQAVTEVKKERDRIVHKVPGHHLAPGQTVTGALDWGRRYDLMSGHTAEHLLFSCLNRQTELELVKISITPHKKSVMVKGALNWEAVIKAQEAALKIIDEGLEIREEIVSRDDLASQDTRAKLERIPGDSIRVVCIGDVDRAACAGVHVKNTRELGLILITKFVSAKPTADHEVEFQVGEKAKGTALELSAAALMSAEALGSRPEDVLCALSNLKMDRQRQETALRNYARQALANLIPSSVNGVKLYSGCFDSMDKKTLQEAVDRIISQESVCVIGTTGERFTLVVACHPSLGIDCVTVLNQALSVVGGRGGGKPNFASGGSPSTEKADEAMVAAIIALRTVIEAAMDK